MNYAPVLFVFASRDGHTRKMAQRMADVLFSLDCESCVCDLATGTPDPQTVANASTIVLLAPVRYGYALPAMRKFIARHKNLIDNRRLALVNINLTARKPNKNQPQTNPYMKKWMKKQKLKPDLAAVFAGCLDYPRYNPFDRFMIRFIMRITGGPCDGKCVVDYTDWDKVDAFAVSIVDMCRARLAA